MALDLVLPVSIIVLALMLALFAFLSTTYRGLVRLKEAVDKNHMSVDSLLVDLSKDIIQLINLIKSQMAYEYNLLISIVSARDELDNAGTLSDKAYAINVINSGLKQLFTNAQSYAALKNSPNYKELSSKIIALQDSISSAIDKYNKSVSVYNFKLESFPNTLVAKAAQLPRKELFQAEEVKKVVLKYV